MFDSRTNHITIELAMYLTRTWHRNRRRMGLPYLPSPYGIRSRNRVYLR